MEAVGDAHGRGVGLVVTGQHGDRPAGGTLGLGQEVGAVLGPPHRLGRDILDLAGPQGLGDVGEASQRLQRALDLGSAEAAGRGEALAERAQRFLVEQGDRRPAQPLVDHRGRIEFEPMSTTREAAARSDRLLHVAAGPDWQRPAHAATVSARRPSWSLATPFFFSALPRPDRLGLVMK